MATLAELRTRVRRRLDELSARFWQDTDLNDWINEGAREVARRSEVLQAVATINSIANTQQYTLPIDVFRVHRVEWSRQGVFTSTAQISALEYRQFNSMDSVWWSGQSTNHGDPYWYTMWGYPPALKLIVYPTPEISIANGFRIYYYRGSVDAAADGTTVDVPAGWEDLIIDYCEFSALRKDADPRWQEGKSLFEDKMNHLIETTRHWTDQAGAVTAGTGSLPSWIWDDGYGW